MLYSAEVKQEKWVLNEKESLAYVKRLEGTTGGNALPDLPEHKTGTQPGRGACKPQSGLGQLPSRSTVGMQPVIVSKPQSTFGEK